ncbi:hypothetical protein LTR08_009210 [Meristemomyces frigidus]|nr:hypothetical protein LTR08_009210 [Meristemomyces frigidus]
MRQSTLRFGREDSKSNIAAKRKATDDSHAQTKRVKSTTTSNAIPPEPQRSSTATTATQVITPESSPGPTPSSARKLQIQEEHGDIFAAPPRTLIIHACNCQGSWGAGIAKAFKDRYPAAYLVYSDHCDDNDPDALFGTALLIPPAMKVSLKSSQNCQAPDDYAQSQFVGCLFTSRSMGRKKDSPARILAATGPAMEDLFRQVREWNAKAEASDRVGEVRMCEINSGLFNVPWKKTRAVLEGIEVGDGDVEVIKVVSRE